MSGHSHTNKARKISPTGRSNVKTGCRTCKVRKVKCDEGRPACHRCISTGRICDGYGIWGGGSNSYGRHSSPERGNSIKSYDVPAITSATSKEDRQCLEWFTYRTASKLPGAFASAFWDTLVFQATSEEPAVMHAVLALSSAHRREGLSIEYLRTDENIPDEYEQYTLRHYSKAIKNVQPHLSTRTRASIRIALITCLLFVIMECIRGRHTAANAHLQAGLKLLEECRTESSVADYYGLFQKASCDSVDAGIIQAFVRLDTHAKMLGYGSRHPHLMLEDSNKVTISSSNFIFGSVNQARQHFDRLFSQIFYLDEQRLRHEIFQDGSSSAELLSRQRQIKNELDSWVRAFKASRAKLYLQSGSRDSFAYGLLRLYHTMAEIMVDTLYPTDESRFDRHTASFISILNHVNEMRDIAYFVPRTDKFFIHSPDMTNSIADLGGMPLLYYTALKCRIHPIRLRAIELLNTLPHKEGIWNSPLVASVALKVMEMEESFFKDFDHNITLGNSFERGNTILPPIPDSYRLHDVRIELPDECNGKVKMTCKRKQEDGRWELITRECTYMPSTR
ncbi:hypothetical protein F5B20DRAFT_67114 [Whalleya microplaca]|nr:hypothetical protein F5B20DRAFT_67114 [Whalleya microplaca]